jgi:hypothetical protein
MSDEEMKKSTELGEQMGKCMQKAMGAGGDMGSGGSAAAPAEGSGGSAAAPAEGSAAAPAEGSAAGSAK